MIHSRPAAPSGNPNRRQGRPWIPSEPDPHPTKDGRQANPPNPAAEPTHEHGPTNSPPIQGADIGRIKNHTRGSYRPQSFKVTKPASVISHMSGGAGRSEAPRVTTGGLSGQVGVWRLRRESVEEQLASFEIAARRAGLDRWGAHRPRRSHRRRHHPSDHSSDHPGGKDRDQTRVSIIDGHNSRSGSA